MHLSQCKSVWQILRPEIDEWIGLIEKGETPDFQASDALRALNEPTFKLLMAAREGSVLRRRSPRGEAGFRSSEVASAVLEARAKMQEEFRRDMNSVIEERFETWWRRQVETGEER